MKRLGLMLAALLMLVGSIVAQHVIDRNDDGLKRLSCTSIMVGKNASADGSVITSHTCDSWYRTWFEMVPAADHKPGETMTIYDGRMHTQSAADSTKLYKKGEIPQVAYTYRFLDSSYPCLNEKQVGIGETTISGREELQNKKGMFMVEELCRVALQRASTAREAIKVMGEMIKKYGYGDSGECLTVADKNEVWIFEVYGEGPDKIGGVWAAVRIPDDEVAVSANISRISTLNLNDKDHYMASDNVFAVAKKMKLWDGKEPFRFWKAYSGTNYFGEDKNYSTREFFILSSLAPSLNLSDTVQELPLSVKPEKKVSAKDVMLFLGSTYEGTRFNLSERLKIKNPKFDNDTTGTEPDSIVSPVANPWMRPDEINMFYALGDSVMKNIRTVSVPWSAYSTVIQLRSWLPDEIGGVAWVLLDNPGESPRFPIFCGNTQLPKLLTVCGNHSYREDAALWYYRKANRLATVKWGAMKDDILKARNYFIDKGFAELPMLEQRVKGLNTEETSEVLNGYTADFFGATIVKWMELEQIFWKKTWTGF